MAVFRVERTRDYTVMSNYHLRDKSLSLKAKGLLSQMLSLPEDWDHRYARSWKRPPMNRSRPHRKSVGWSDERTKAQTECAAEFPGVPP